VVVQKKLAFIAAAVGAFGSTAVLAATPNYGYGGYGLYMGASAGALYYNEEGLAQMVPTILDFHIGQQFNQYLAIEARLGTNVSGGSAFGSHINSNVIYGGYIKGLYPLNPWFSVYGIAGLGGADWHRNYPHYNSNDIGLSFGVGGEFNVGGNAAVNVEWARLTSGDNGSFGYSADTLMFGVNWRIQ
jgi:opacity protein-like surface antigen